MTNQQFSKIEKNVKIITISTFTILVPYLLYLVLTSKILINF